MYKENEVKKIYHDNQEVIKNIINEKSNEHINRLTKYLVLDNGIKEKLKVLEKEYIEEYIKDKIEYKLIIEDLYPDEMKKEALNKLPQYILGLR